MPAGLLKEPPPGWVPAVFEDLDGWTRARRILFVRLDSIGDVLMTTPAVRAFKERGNGGRSRTTVTLLTSPAGATAARLVPEIDHVITYEAPWMKSTPLRLQSRGDREMIALLRQRRFDAAVIPTVYSQNPLPSALLCYLAEIPLRAAHCHENPYQLLTHWIRDPEPEIIVRHEVQRQLDLAAALGAATGNRSLSLRVTAGARSQVESLLRSAGLTGGRLWILAHPGATAPSRRYPPPLFGRALRLVQEQTGAAILLSGDERDRPLVAEVAAELAPEGWSSVAGRTDVETLAALVEAAPLLVANNTGPVHMAAAVGTPVVDLYALTNPQHAPWQVPNRVLFADVPCRICYRSVCPEGHHRCLRDVPPEAVAAAATELLAETGPSARTGQRS